MSSAPLGLILLIAASGLALAGCIDRVPETEAALPLDPTPSLDDARPEAAPGVAVVELFTSEGCSSCPPADGVLRDLAARADETGEALFPLSFHVDYWDRLGWADPYADAAYSERQRAYAATGAFARGRVYTPGMIVNGERGFVGSRRATAEARIDAALATAPEAAVVLRAEVLGRDVRVAYAVEGATGVLNLALVQDETAQHVTRGENRGRRLRHAHVVRDFAGVEAGTGTATLRLPDDLAPGGAHVVGYVQTTGVGPVVGAAQVRLGD